MSGTVWNVRLITPAILGAVLVVSAGVEGCFRSTNAIATETLKATEPTNSPTPNSPVLSTAHSVATISVTELDGPSVAELEARASVTISKPSLAVGERTGFGKGQNTLTVNHNQSDAPEFIRAEEKIINGSEASSGASQTGSDNWVITSKDNSFPALSPSPQAPLITGNTGEDGAIIQNLTSPESSSTSPSVPTDATVLQQIEHYSNDSPAEDTIEQVTNVSQLRDVSPSDWAFEALRSLVERYGCIAGYPDRTYRGNRSMTRYEFAAGLNACVQQMERLIAASGEGAATKKDLTTLQRLIEEFGPELAILRGRVDALEARTTELELTQFSTTTKLDGEVVLGLTGIFSGQNFFGQDLDNINILGTRTRLSFDTSFTGRDLLRTRLQASGLTTFTSRTQTFEGNLAFADEDANNNLKIDALLYRFPIGQSTEVVIAANGGRVYDFANTLNYLDGDGAFGALSRFGTRNPIYYLAEGSGIGIRQQLGNTLELSLGYLAGDTANPRRNGGLFGGPYGALAQLVYKPTSRFQIGFTYINSYNRETLTGSPFSNPRTFLRNIANQPVNINFQPPTVPGTPRFFPANQPIPAGEVLPVGTQLPPGTRLTATTTLPFPITVPRPGGLPGTITIPAGTRIPAGTTLPTPVTLPLDLVLPVPITIPLDLTIPAAVTPPLPPIVFNGTIGQLLSQPEFAGVPLGFNLDIPIISNSYGIQLSWQVSDGFVLGGWVGYTTNTTLSTGNGLFSRGNANTINGALTLAFPDLGKRGNLGGIIVGVEPFVLDTNIQVNQNFVNPTSLNPALIPAGLALLNSTPVITRLVDIFNNPDPDVSLHIEAFYQMQLTDNISVTPGVIWITAPGSVGRNSDLVIGTIRTTFSF
jgi:hypothetical protein